uniref:CTLH domain-containing protein n=1 Tax=Chromera velia CCMP2878 TaxID=1169474 RepID=A0A0G4GYX2_9ALVE|mmetsp:Transcript_12020/g.23141  ORF Transcript_12020/g.23141 Transcript_12020/m.23141 type:complete len:308 (+) Transcript_12020:242-1165(+)|eukprot:Cvel_23976.t1-p1 / transcript=Cvel_23976.t1 / gene=Cvel_23976 / organism=Chromera_velia_CCMP2878 / gene_product=Glucose-induced degradation protein 8 homolog, putative / transcript_product=Glucose-induced degradation protein 8 homolog, putative / location=Cvel_scaffold2538:13525-14445(-) / protein_length=307 / sequence_SO=supercontig / SO=protein_coding / is_pseudo=false
MMDIDSLESSPNPVLDSAAWLKRLQGMEVLENDIHAAILNFLTVYGHHDAALEFAREANIQTDVPLTSLRKRQVVKDAVLKGDVKAAEAGLNELDPGILEKNPDLKFELRQHELLNLITAGDVQGALQFAQNHLADAVRKDKRLLPKLEAMMALLAFSDPEKVKEARQASSVLVSSSEELAGKIDEMILDFFAVHKESTLETILKETKYSEECLTREGVSLPLLKDVARSVFSVPECDGLSSSQRNLLEEAGGGEEEEEEEKENGEGEGGQQRRWRWGEPGEWDPQSQRLLASPQMFPYLPGYSMFQ